MKIYLVSNNLLQENLAYSNNSNLDLIRMARCLNEKGEGLAKKISENNIFNDIEKIYTSFYSSALSTSKYLANKLELQINMDEKLNECKVGMLGNKNMKMVKGLQDHEFSYKLPNGESLIDVGNRINNFIMKISGDNLNTVLFTHKRAILGLLMKYCEVGFNLDDNLILQFNDKIVYDDIDTDIDIYELEFQNNKITNLSRIM